jgi:anti-sigma regulatory factor (Ser/Thr protein kinase)
VRDDEVRLAVPAMPQYVRLVRLAIAALAGQLGFSFDAIEDLRIAVDELCYLLIGVDGQSGSITMRFCDEGGALVVVGEGTAGEDRPQFGELSAQILAATVDEHTVTHRDGHVTCRMVRRREQA